MQENWGTACMSFAWNAEKEIIRTNSEAGDGLALFSPIDFLLIKRYNIALTEQTALVENLQKGRR